MAMITNNKNKIKKIPKIVLAKVPATFETLPKPKAPATIDIIRNNIAQPNIDIVSGIWFISRNKKFIILDQANQPG